MKMETKKKISTLNQKENAQQEDRDEDGNRLERCRAEGRKLSFGSTDIHGEVRLLDEKYPCNRPWRP
jgi:uncharacterized protein YlxW (UPF0749 family)